MPNIVTNKVRLLNTTKNSGEDVFAIDTMLEYLSDNTFAQAQTDIDMGEWGTDFKLFSYDGFAYAINPQYILYLTYPLIRNLTKEERKALLVYRFGEAGAGEIRKPRTGDVCLYFGKVTASKINSKGKPMYTVSDSNMDAIQELAENHKLRQIESEGKVVAFVPQDYVGVVLEAIQHKKPSGI